MASWHGSLEQTTWYSLQIWNIRKHVEATKGFETYSNIFYYHKILYFLNIDKTIIG